MDTFMVYIEPIGFYAPNEFKGIFNNMDEAKSLMQRRGYKKDSWVRDNIISDYRSYERWTSEQILDKESGVGERGVLIQTKMNQPVIKLTRKKQQKKICCPKCEYRCAEEMKVVPCACMYSMI